MTTDPVTREREAREQMARLTDQISHWAAIRRQALHDLHKELGTWQKVANSTGQKLAAVHKAARQPQGRKTTP